MNSGTDRHFSTVMGSIKWNGDPSNPFVCLVWWENCTEWRRYHYSHDFCAPMWWLSCKGMNWSRNYATTSMSLYFEKLTKSCQHTWTKLEHFDIRSWMEQDDQSEGTGIRERKTNSTPDPDIDRPSMVEAYFKWGIWFLTRFTEICE